MMIAAGLLVLASCKKEQECDTRTESELQVEFTNKTGEDLKDFTIAGTTTDVKNNKTTCPIGMESLMFMGTSVMEGCSARMNGNEILGFHWFCATGAEIVTEGRYKVDVGTTEMNDIEYLTLELK